MKKLGLRGALVVIGCVAIAVGFFVGIDDNLPMIALVFGGIICLILAAVYRWRRPKSFFLLFVLSALGFVVFAVLHNVFHVIDDMTTISWVKVIVEGLDVASFFIALLVCPAGVVVGLPGWAVMLVRTRKASEAPSG
jgi:hypothetical protein